MTTAKKHIIGVCGFIGSGKDTVADYLVNFHEFRRESFANTLKDAVSAVFGWPRDMLEGRTKESRQWRETRDDWWSERLGKEITPRWILQYWGTDVLRTNFHDDIWIASLENKIRSSKDSIVISDCRFPNEIIAIRNQGGIVVRIVRGPEPIWIDHAINYNAGKTRIGWAIGKDQLARQGIHPSEYSWIGADFDLVLDNNSTLDHLYSQIKNLVQDPQPSKEVGIYKPLADNLNISF
jgi:hypothetical protein